MKKLIKIIALAAIAALAAISCSSEVEETGYDWRINDQISSKLNTAITGTDAFPTKVEVTNVKDVKTNDGTTVTTYSDIEITITFSGTEEPSTTADVLREKSAASIESKLKEFLHFYNVDRKDATGDQDPNEVPDGTVYAIDNFIEIPSSSWNYLKRNGNEITVVLDTAYVSGTTRSQIVYKIDSTKFTYGRGSKVDKDENGTAGEAIYDDKWDAVAVEAGVTTGYGATPYNGIVYPGNNIKADAWYFTIGSVPATIWGSDTTEDAVLINDIVAATLTNPSSGDAHDEILSQFATNFKLQKYNGSKWETYRTSELDGSAIVFKDNTLNHLVPYRIVYDGGAKRETEKEYYGVKQRITIRGKDYKAEENAYWREQAVIEGDFDVPYNPGKVNFTRPDVAKTGNKFTVEVYSKDANNKNVVLEFDAFYAQKADPQGGADIRTNLKDISLANFKKSFKIYYKNGREQIGTGTYDDVVAEKNLIEVTIKNVVLAEKDIDAGVVGTDPIQEYPVLRITLDPNYQVPEELDDTYTYILINNGLGYEDDKNVFGRAKSYFNNYFDAYEVKETF